jgi:hypothetical protein
MLELLNAIFGLFIDDELLAIGVLGMVGLIALLLIALLLNVVGIEPLIAGAILLFGNLLALTAGVVRTTRRRP